MNRAEDRAKWTPAEARREFRQNKLPGISTGNIALGHVQASVAILPSSVAGDFAQFCAMNKAPCPLLYQATPGEVCAPALTANSDIRTDLSMYTIMENGQYTKVAPDVLDIPFHDLVSFYIGCSYSFERALKDSGLPLRHLAAGSSVPGYITNIPCYSAGPFHANMVTTMRPFPRELVQKAVEVTADLDLVHGAPIHIGHPCWIGIEDFSHPDFDDPPVNQEEDVCVFWACGTTAPNALKNANLPFVIGLGPETNRCVFITDHKVADFFKSNPPEHGSLKPRVLFTSEEPVFASLLSDKALEQIQELEKVVKQESIKVNGEINQEPDIPADYLAKAAIRLSHASSVAIVTLDDSRSSEASSVLSITKAAMATGNKNVILLAPESKLTEWNDVIARCVDAGILKEPVRVVQLLPREDSSDILEISRRMLSNMDEFKLEGSYPHKYTALVGPGKQGGHWVTCAAELMTEWGANHVTTITNPGWPGDAVAAAMYFLNCCPIHDRYIRKGLGLYNLLESAEFMMRLEELEALMGGFTSGREEDVIKKINAVVSSSSEYISSCMHQAKA